MDDERILGSDNANGHVYSYETFSTDEKKSADSKTDKTPRCLGISRVYWTEMWVIFDFAWTIMVNNLSTNLIPAMSLMFSGKLGVDELGAVGLGNTILVVLGTRQTAGLSTACDTLFAQTYGSERRRDMGIYLQKSFMILSLFILPCWAIHLNGESLLLLIGTDARVAQISGDYLSITLGVLPFHCVYWIIFKYVRCQGYTKFPMMITVTGLLINVAVQYLMVNYASLGTTGSAIAYLMNYSILSILLLTWWFATGVYKPTWSGWCWDALQDWGMFYSLAIAGMLMVQLQWWAFELGTLTAGLLGKIALGAQSIAFQVENVTYQIPMGIGIAANLRVGHQLGANNPEGAKCTVKSAYCLIVILCSLLMCVLFATKDYIPRLFSEDSEVIALVSELISILAIYNMMDGLSAGSAGMLRGCGQQHIAAAIVFIGMYLIGLPIGFSLMFLTDIGIAGFWYGLTVALAAEAAMYMFCVSRIDWKLQAAKAQERSKVAKSKFLAKAKVIEGESGNTDSCKLLVAPESTTVPLPRRHHVDETNSSQPNLILASHTPSYLNRSQLLYRRSLTFLGFLLPLLLGIVCRFYLAPASDANSCAQRNQTFINATDANNSTAVPC